MKNIYSYGVLMVLLCLVTRFNVSAQSGEIDSNFGENGWFIFPSLGQVSDLAVQKDGKILVQENDKLLRLLPSGVIDNLFDINGQLEDAFAFTLSEDDKIITLLSPFGENNPHLARLNSNGLPDTGFGQNGQVRILDLLPTFRITGQEQVLVKPNGKINLFSTVELSTGELKVVVLQYLPDGNVDTEFGNNGVSVPLPEVEIFFVDAFKGAQVAADNSVIFLGECGEGSFCITKLRDDGSLDENFGVGGIAGASLSFDRVETIALQDDAKIILGGEFEPSNTEENGDFLMVRYNSDGTLDTDFGVNGKVITSFQEQNDKTEVIFDLEIQPDGKILAIGRGAGHRIITTGLLQFDFSAIGVARYLPNGELDTNFSDDGFEIIDFKSAKLIDLGILNEAQIALGSDGSIFLGANTNDPDGESAIVVLKLGNDFATNISSPASSFKIYPQPSQDYLKLELDNPQPDFSWNILDLQGNSLLRGNAQDNRTQIDLRSLPNAIYVLEVRTSKTVQYQKIHVLK